MSNLYRRLLVVSLGLLIVCGERQPTATETFQGLDVLTPVSMQWVIKNVPAGSSPEMQVVGVTQTGNVGVFLERRTLSIDVFYGLL